VRDAIAFGAALAGRDFAGAADPAAGLLREAGAGRFWIPPDDLLDGGVRALLAAGRPDDARAAYDLMRRHSTRVTGDLRLLLLDSYIESARESVH
jgi:pentatricopeptide repeat protein